MDWIWINMDQHPPNLGGCGLDMDISINIHFHPLIKRCFMGFLDGLEIMYELLEW
jgi:hypothetical protein